MTTGAGSWCRRGHCSCAQLYRRVNGNRIASDNVVRVREVLSLDDRTECGENAPTKGESIKQIGTRKGVLCSPRRPKYNHCQKGALIQREKDHMPDQGIDQGLDQGIDQGLDQGLDQGIDQGIDQGLAQA